MTTKKNEQIVWISGRRKTSVARVKLAKGSGLFVINETKALSDVFPQEIDQKLMVKPFVVTGRDVRGYDVSIKLQGGGKKSQLEAASLGIAKALVEMEENLKPLLKSADLLTRDPRMKERKKYGLKRARKAPQYSKR